LGIANVKNGNYKKGCFKKGQKALHPIKKGQHLSPATQFRKGHVPWKKIILQAIVMLLFIIGFVVDLENLISVKIVVKQEIDSIGLIQMEYIKEKENIGNDYVPLVIMI
jgi:hypothetical protein